MRRFFLLILCLCLLTGASPVQADRYILHSPGRGQLKSEEAVAVAQEWITRRQLSELSKSRGIGRAMTKNGHGIC